MLLYFVFCILYFVFGTFVYFHHLVVSLDVKVGEVDGDSPLGRCNDLPDAVLVAASDDDDEDNDNDEDDDMDTCPLILESKNCT